jgi:septum site-determining protein MinC
MARPSPPSIGRAENLRPRPKRQNDDRVEKQMMVATSLPDGVAPPATETTAPSASGPAFELKGTLTPVTVLRLRTSDVPRVVSELRARIEPAPQLFLHAPVVVDVAELDAAAPLALAALAEQLRALHLSPVGVANLGSERLALAAAAGLAVVQLGPNRARPAAPSAPVETARPAGTPTGSLTIRQPVRGGQVIYAQRCDLVVLAPVNAGAQVIADGHVHIYGPLRGRALAGAQGMADARVFCQSLEAELISVAGQYLMADEIPVERRGKPVQIFVDDGRFRILPLSDAGHR